MTVLTLSSSQSQFTQFLLGRFGIEGNMLTVDEARAATRNVRMFFSLFAN